VPEIGELYVSHPFWVWISFAAALLAIEVATGSGWLLWASASAAAVAVIAAIAPLSFSIATLVFALLTIVSTLLARRYLPRSVTEPGQDINDPERRLVGSHGVAVAAFAGRTGRVFVDGKEWAAELEQEEALDAGARVEVVAVAGARLRVKSA
jgi:membrane protein implicated in regulation of membrane protease activity